MRTGPACTGIALLLLGACGSPDTTPSKDNSGHDTRCYMLAGTDRPLVIGADTLVGPEDTLLIRLDLLGELANGMVRHHPARPWHRQGTFTGALEDGVITALYSGSTADGRILKQEVLLRPEEGGLRMAEGDQLLTEGILLFKDRGQVHFGRYAPEVACRE